MFHRGESPSDEVRAWHLGHREIITCCCEWRTLSIPESTLEHHLKWRDPVHVNNQNQNLSDAKPRERSGVKCCALVVPRAYFCVRRLVSVSDERRWETRSNRTDDCGSSCLWIRWFYCGRWNIHAPNASLDFGRTCWNRKPAGYITCLCSFSFISCSLCLLFLGRMKCDNVGGPKRKCSDCPEVATQRNVRDGPQSKSCEVRTFRKNTTVMFRAFSLQWWKSFSDFSDFRQFTHNPLSSWHVANTLHVC